MRRVQAIVTDTGGRTAHAAIVSREFGLPCIVGTGTATSAIRTGDPVTVCCADGEDGSVYPLQGRVEFAEPIVDPATGAVTLRARFPNPQGVLLPGMYVRARFVQGVVPDAILVPQQAVTRSPRGEATVLVVGPEDRATLRKIAAERTIGDKWLVTQGLAAGDKVITEGLGKVKPGQRVRPVPAGAPPSRPGARPA